MKRVVIVSLAGLAALAAAAPAALAQQGGNYVAPRPPMMLTPNPEPWVMQLRPDRQRRHFRPVIVEPTVIVPGRGWATGPGVEHWPNYASRSAASIDGVPTSPRRRWGLFGRPKLPTMDPEYLPRIVPYKSSYKQGTIIIDTDKRFLYLVLADGKAKRYGVGVGREGFSWKGTERVTRKKEWPDWRPPADMLMRQPELPHFVPGGPRNPLGARALYLGTTLYRIHGSNEPWTIGRAVSSGCIRMRNEDVMDLYDRVAIGATVVVL